MPEYNDLYLRQSLTQRGAEHGAGTASPDVIPWGTQVDPDPAALGREPAYSADLGQGLAPGVANFLYLRTRNPDTAERLGQLFLARTAPTYIGWPDTLVAIPSTGGKPYYQLKVPAGEVGVSLAAFSYIPEAAGELLAGWITTPQHRIDPPRLDSLVDLAAFFATPGYVQRSVGFGLSHGDTGDYHFVGRYDQRAAATSILIAFHCTDCKGWTIALRPTEGDRTISFGPVIVPQDGPVTLSFDVDVPAGYQSVLDLAIESNGVALRPTSRIDCRMYLRDGQQLTALGGHLWRAHPPDRHLRSQNPEEKAPMADDWNDLYVRTALGEKGPGPDERQGQLGSPDVIPTGITPVDPQPYTTQSSWDTYVSNLPAQAGKPNYIYVRAKNSSPSGNTRGVAYLDMTDPAVVLWPGGDKWTRIKTSNAGTYQSQLLASNSQDVPPGAIAITTDPFAWVPSESGHRCLVSWLSTQKHPDPGPPPKITNITDLVTFLKTHPAYAHHNIDVTPNDTGAVTQTAPFAAGTLQAKWAFGIRAVNCKGFNVSFSSATPVNGKYITFGPATVPQDDPITLTIDDLEIPIGWSTTFNYTYEQNNLTPPSFAVSFVAFYVPLETDPHYALASTARQLGIPPGSVSSTWRGIPVGSLGVMKGSIGVKP